MTQAEALAIGVAALAGIALAVWQRDNIAELAGGDTPSEDQTAGSLYELGNYVDPTTWGQDDMNTTNRQAFLRMLRVSEGTAGEGGYNALFGWPAKGRSFYNYADHPRRFFDYTDKAGKTIKTSAAGAYQITATTFDDVAPRLGVDDFTPASQDAIALELIRQRGALADIDAGRFESAVSKVRRVWASLPGAGYNQPERDITTLAQAYARAGGTFA